MCATLKHAGVAGPQREAVVMARGEHAVLHLGGDRGVSPLAGIEARRVEQLDVQVRLRPRPRVREDAEVDEHAEAQLDEVALKLFEWLAGAARRGLAGGGRSARRQADRTGARQAARTRTRRPLMMARRIDHRRAGPLLVHRL